MSATLITSKITITEQKSYADSLGYAYCSKCVENVSRPVVTHSPIDDSDLCDTCGIKLSNSFESVTGPATTEYFQCKIY